MRDGWHTLSGYEIYIDGGKVVRGLLFGCTAYPYRKSRSGGWDNCSGISAAAFRSGVYRGTIKLI